MSMTLRYVSSTGQVFDLQAASIRARRANFHDYQWTPQVKNLQYGDRVYRFNKEALYYTVILDIRKTLDERKATLNTLHAAFDADIFSMTPGRIVHGEYYILCYITFSSTYAENPYTTNELSVYCPYPFWVKENAYDMPLVEDTSEANDFLDLGTMLPDYASASGAVATFNANYADRLGSLVVDIDLVQAGSGDPATDNVRAISGQTICTVSVGAVSGTADEEYTVSWIPEAGTVYGGMLDVVTGLLTVTKEYRYFDGSETAFLRMSTTQPGNVLVALIKEAMLDGIKVCGYKTVSGSTCNIYTQTSVYGIDRGNTGMAVDAAGNILIRDPDIQRLDQFVAQLQATPMQVVYELETPVTYQLTAQEVRSLLGTNNIWASTGDVSLEYVTGYNLVCGHGGDYDYDYESHLTGQALVVNPGSGPADFLLRIYGPCVNPYVSINGVDIGVTATVQAGEYVEIDSRDKTVYRVDTNGVRTNLFNQRLKTTSIFTKIPSGNNVAIWPGTFTCELIVYEERSEPKWS